MKSQRNSTNITTQCSERISVKRRAEQSRAEQSSGSSGSSGNSGSSGRKDGESLETTDATPKTIRAKSLKALTNSIEATKEASCRRRIDTAIQQRVQQLEQERWKTECRANTTNSSPVEPSTVKPFCDGDTITKHARSTVSTAVYER